ncbi:prolyl oligopeptidase family serine peptidase [Chryseobacterium sp.]|uniref:alpha/beta hydrolase family protein n=1 Tax=Chryseobacterium sp. TaxID=1871047 RepID=UPI0025BE4534|nr:prolyl oligopeptidase family serine peptidase [Chryseobacterium sp.]
MDIKVLKLLLCITTFLFWIRGKAQEVSPKDSFIVNSPAGITGDHFGEYYVSRLVADAPGVKWMVINNKNNYGKNEFKLIDTVNNESEILPLAFGYIFLDKDHLLISSKEGIIFKGLKEKKEILIKGRHKYEIFPISKKVLLYNSLDKQMGIYDFSGKKIFEQNNIISYDVGSDSSLKSMKSGIKPKPSKLNVKSAKPYRKEVLFYATDEYWKTFDLQNLEIKSIKTEDPILKSWKGKDVVYGLSKTKKGIFLHQWKYDLEGLKYQSSQKIDFPVGYTIDMEILRESKLREDRFLILYLKKQTQDKSYPLAVEIRYSNRSDTAPDLSPKFGIYDLREHRWTFSPNDKEVFTSYKWVGDNKGDFIIYNKEENVSDTLSNPKYRVTLFTRYGLKKSLLLNPYVSTSNFLLVPDAKSMLFFKSGRWQVEDLESGIVKELPLDGFLTWILEEYSGLEDKPQGKAWLTSAKGKVWLQEKYDLYEWDIFTGKIKRLTFGRQQHIKYVVSSSLLNKGIIDTNKKVLLETENSLSNHFGLSWFDKGKIKPVYWGKEVVYNIRENEGALLFSTQGYESPLTIMKNEGNKTIVIYKSPGKDGEKLEGRRMEVFQYNVNNVTKKAVLLYPQYYDSQKKYPMVLNIYENISEKANYYSIPDLYDTGGFNPAYYTYKGYFVLLPDIHYDRDKQSIIESVENAVKGALDLVSINPQKIGITGISFGGYETGLILGRTDIFKTAVMGVMIADLPSHAMSFSKLVGGPDYYRTERNQTQMGKSLFEDYDAYLKSSPLYYAKEVKSPVLIWTGMEDDNVNPMQSAMYYLGLKRLKKPAILLRYPKEGHAISSPKNRQDLGLKTFQWFEHFLRDQPTADWMKPIVSH